MNKRPPNVSYGREATLLTIRRGDIWLVSLDPTLGAEIRKTRPAVVVSSDAVGILPVKLVAPITDWKGYYAHNVWHVQILPDESNGLSKVSAVDVLQLRGVDAQRFTQKLGRASPIVMDTLASAIAAIVEYDD